MGAVNKVIAVAEGEIGYLEKKSNAQLDDKTANAGSANYTKYWRDVYPAFQAQAWCAAFVSWCFMKAFGLEAAKKLLKHWPFTYCPTLAGMTTNKTPKVGSIVLFYRNGTYAHTGLVVAVTSTTITTIEVNTSGASGIIANGGGVCKKTYAISSLSTNTKYFMPDYSLVEESQKTEPVKPDTKTEPKYYRVRKSWADAASQIGAFTDLDNAKKACKSGYTVYDWNGNAVYPITPTPAPQVTISADTIKASGYTFAFGDVCQGSSGKDVKLTQILLNAHGANLSIDGDCGSKTAATIKKYQKDFGLTVDGVVGQKTWAALLMRG